MQVEACEATPERWTRQSIGVLALCSLAFAFYSYELTVLSLATPAIMSELNVSRADIGVLNAILGWIVRISGFIVIPLADVIGRRLMVVLVVLGFSLLTGLTGLSQNFLQLTVLASLTRIPLSASTLSGTMALESAPTRARATVLGLWGAGYPVGFLLSSALSIYLIPALGWRSLYFIGVVPALLVFLFLRYAPESPHYEKVRAKRQERGRGTSLVNTYLTVLRDYRVETILGALAFFCFSWTWLGFLAWVPTYLNVELGQGQALSSTYVTVWTVGAMLGYVGYGFVADRWGRRFTMPIVTLLAGAMFATLGLVRDPMVLLVYGFLLVMLILGPYGAGLGYVQEIFPTEVRATGWAIATGVGGVLGGFAPLVGGMTPTIATAFPVYALPLLLVAPLYLFVFKEMIGKELVDAVDESGSEAGGDST